MQLKIALLQIAPAGDLQSAVRKGEEYCKIAKAGGADIALFPELYSCGYNIACLPPEKWQPLAQGGIFENSFSQLAARLEMAIGITYLCNYPAGVQDCNGNSTVYDGMAFKDGDMCVLRAPEDEGIYFANVGLDALRAYRREETMGNAYRRPSLYKDLVCERVDEPFIRKDARR